MTTAQVWIDQARDRLTSGSAQAEPLNELAVNYTAGSGSLQLGQPTGALQPGCIISAGLNTFHVWNVNNNTVTVRAGLAGSTDMDLPAGTLVRVRPRWTDWQLFTALNQELDSLAASGLFQVMSTEFTYSLPEEGYNLGSLNLLRVLDVRFQTPGPAKNWPRVLRWRVDRVAPTEDFPSGLALRVDSGAWPGRPVQVIYAAPFTQLVDLTTDVASTGLAASAYRIPPLGAAITCQSGVDVARTRMDTQGDTRRSDEVPAQSPGLSIRNMSALRQQWLNEEKQRLETAWPIRLYI